MCVWERSVSCSVATHVVAYKHTHTPTHIQFCCALHVRTHLCVYTLLNLICLHLCIYVNETLFTFLHRMHIYTFRYMCTLLHVVHLYTQCNIVHRLLKNMHCLRNELLAGRVCPHAHDKLTTRSALELSHIRIDVGGGNQGG